MFSQEQGLQFVANYMINTLKQNKDSIKVRGISSKPNAVCHQTEPMFNDSATFYVKSTKNII